MVTTHISVFKKQSMEETRTQKAWFTPTVMTWLDLNMPLHRCEATVQVLTTLLVSEHGEGRHSPATQSQRRCWRVGRQVNTNVTLTDVQFQRTSEFNIDASDLSSLSQRIQQQPSLFLCLLMCLLGLVSLDITTVAQESLINAQATSRRPEPTNQSPSLGENP